jgi:hypothetical protein
MAWQKLIDEISVVDVFGMQDIYDAVYGGIGTGANAAGLAPKSRWDVLHNLGFHWGIATLVAGTVTVPALWIRSSSLIWLTDIAPSGTQGMLSVSAIAATASFTISSSNALDTGTVAWLTLEP